MRRDREIRPHEGAAARRPRVIHPFLIAVYPILALYSRLAQEVPPGELGWPIAVALAVTLAGWIASTALLRGDTRRAGFLVSLGLVLIYTIRRATPVVNSILTAVSEIWIREVVRLWPPMVMGVEVVLVGAVAYLVLAKLKGTAGLTSFLNLFTSILVALPALTAVEALSRDRPEPVRHAPLARLAAPAHRPDIYYIILDGFARGDVMREVFGLDVEPMLAHLEGKGFYVARRSTANYSQTRLSIPSSINGQYLDTVVDLKSRDTSQLLRAFGDNAVFESLRKLGYKFVLFGTGVDVTDQPEAGDYRAPDRYVSDFHRMILDMTPFWNVVVRQRDQYSLSRERTLYLFDRLPRIAYDRAPTFTLAHVVAPHPPFLFNERGEDVSPHETPYVLVDGRQCRDYYGGLDAYLRGYRGQAAFVARRVVEVIDQILERSPEPPIILLQSDHGSGSRLDLDSLAATDVKERMGILNAYYLPDSKREGLHQAITPVNSFRVVFNNLFGASLPLLPDRSYYSTWFEPYQFIDVTDRVAAASPTAHPAPRGPLTSPPKGDGPRPDPRRCGSAPPPVDPGTDAARDGWPASSGGGPGRR